MKNDSIKPKVLLVDDVPENIQILMETLKDDYAIIAATNGEKALQLASGDNMPDIILLDIMMPEMDGYEVCQRLKKDEKTRNIPVIFVTAMQEVEDETKGLELGAVDYITKPISPSIVRARVKNHLELEFTRKTLEEQNQELREAARLREDVEKITRHDLKSPLNMIIGAPQAIKTFGEINERQKKYLGYIEETGYRMLDMINRSLDLFKMEQGLYECKFEQVDITNTLKKIVTETQSLCAMNDVKINVFVNGKPSTEEDTFFITGETLLVFPMLENLIKNAIEASPEGAHVGVFLDEDDSLRIRIQNRGAVPEDIRDKFFDKYVTSEKEKGTGIGTYSAKLIAETMNGNISMESSEKKGTAITLVFPKDQQALGESDMRKILVVDDEAQNHELLKDFLEIRDYEVITANGGKEALEKIKEKPALVLLDVMMPDMNGLQVLEKIKEIAPSMEVIMVTSMADEDIALSSLKKGACDYITKPIDLNHLENVIDLKMLQMSTEE